MKKLNPIPNIILNILLIFMCVIIIIILAVKVRAQNNNITHIKEDEKEETVYIGISQRFQFTKDLGRLKNLVFECDQVMEAAHQMAENARVIGYDENHPVIELARNEYQDAYSLKQAYINIINEVKREEFEKKKKEYPVATEVWLFLKENGFSDYATAGIIGNMMAEVGGQTLDLKYNISSYGYYGLCQWNTTYYKSWGLDLSEQCNLLISTIENEFNLYGYCYEDNFTYSDFKDIQNEQQAALAFAVVYERCNSGSYYIRKSNATTAYNYFSQDQSRLEQRGLEDLLRLFYLYYLSILFYLYINSIYK